VEVQAVVTPRPALAHLSVTLEQDRRVSKLLEGGTRGEP
jgi:hypothetical protein